MPLELVRTGGNEYCMTTALTCGFCSGIHSSLWTRATTAYLRPSTTGKVFLQLYQKDQQLGDITGQKV